jgi:pilus assembly protein CpaF
MEFWLFDQSTNSRVTLNVEADPILIGRDADCHIVLKGAFIGKKHAKIYRKGNMMMLENLSRSITRVTNKEVPMGKPVRIDFGDELQIAQYSIAMIRPGARGKKNNDRTELQRQLMVFEQSVHADLLERLNLRVTGSFNKNDANFVTQIILTLESLLEKRVAELDEQIIEHAVHQHLHRAIVGEVVRQSQGKVQTDYLNADERLMDPQREKAIADLVASFIDMMPLLFEPNSVNEDLAIAEESFDELLPQNYGNIPRELRRYMVRRSLAKDLQDIMFGLGPIQDLLEMANVSEIMVVGRDRIYIEKNGQIQATSRTFFSDEILLSIIERILTPVGRRVDHSTPLVDARLLDGSRVNVIISPLSLVGPCLTIRKFSWIPFTIDDLIERSALSAQCSAFLQGCVIGRKNIVISGGTGSGKTTLLNTLSSFARPNERIITIEESAELRLPQPHVVGLEGRPANVEGRGAYTIKELVKNALRMRPDRIIIGEVRGPEAMDMLQAMNTGHDGSLSTLHANTPVDACHRLETLVLMAVEMPIRAIREQIVTAVDLVIQVTRFPSGMRRITHITEVTEIDKDNGTIRLEDIFVLKDPNQARLRHTGYIPTFTQELLSKNFIDINCFL